MYNCAAVYVTKYLSAIWHAILDNFRPITIWYVILFLVCSNTLYVKSQALYLNYYSHYFLRGVDLLIFYVFLPGSGESNSYLYFTSFQCELPPPPFPLLLPLTFIISPFIACLLFVVCVCCRFRRGVAGDQLAAARWPHGEFFIMYLC